jgi:hypothetical protein
VKHHYPELSDLAAPRTVSLSLDDVRAILRDEPDILFAWVCPCLGYLALLNVQRSFWKIQYREFCLKLMLSIFARDPVFCRCQFYYSVFSLIGRDLGMLWTAYSFVDANKSTCMCPDGRIGIHMLKAEFSGIAALPKFSSVL